MALIKKVAGKTETPARTVSVNTTEELINKFKKWDGKTLVDIDATTELKSITVGRKEWDGGTIVNLIIGFPKGDRVAFPLSRGFSATIDEDETELLNGEFYVSKKMKEGDEEGNPTGDTYISFGKPSGLTFDEEKSLVDAEAVAQ